MRFSEEKRPFLWLKVAAAVLRQRRDVTFLMIGNGPLHQGVAAAAQLNGVAERLILPGTERNAALAIAAMDVFLLTSRKEGFPNVLVEAQSLGVPVVSTVAGGASETFEDGVTGRLVATDDPEDIAAAVLNIIDEKEWRRNVLCAGPRFVAEQFALTRMVCETLSLYRLSE